MSSFLYGLGRTLVRRRHSVVLIWLLVFAAAVGGAVFNKGTDDTFTVPGTESQDALDYLGRVFPEVSGTSAQTLLVTERRRVLDSRQLRLGRLPVAVA